MSSLQKLKERESKQECNISGGKEEMAFWREIDKTAIGDLCTRLQMPFINSFIDVAHTHSLTHARTRIV